MNMLRIITLFGFFAGATSAQSETKLDSNAFILDWGYACEPLPTQVESGHDTVDGEVIVGDANTNYIQEKRVPTQIGITFGVIINVPTSPKSGLYVSSVTHPPMGDQEITQQTWPFSDGPGIGLVGYTLEDPYELVPGDWTFRLHDGDSILFSKTFHLEPPPPGQPLECFGETPNS